MAPSGTFWFRKLESEWVKSEVHAHPILRSVRLHRLNGNGISGDE